MKVYTKPELFFESFELAQHIAACDLKLTTSLSTATTNGCKGDGVLAGLPVSGAFRGDDEDCSVAFDDYCYQASTEIPLTHMS